MWHRVTGEDEIKLFEMLSWFLGALYISNNKLDQKTLFALYSYIYKKEGKDIFIFSDIFDIEFQKINNLTSS